MKLAEEREQKLLKRKELKKIKQKSKVNVEKSESKNEISANTNGQESPKAVEANENTFNEDTAENNFNPNNKTGADENANVEEFVGEKLEEPKHSVELEEHDEGFIGPKLPRMMTQEEISEFYKELMAKYKFPS